MLVLYGTLTGTAPRTSGVPLGIAILLLAGSDFMFERSNTRPGLFPIAIGLGMVSGLIIGILFNLEARQAGIPPAVHLTFFGVGILAAVSVYRYLQVEPALQIPIYIYLLQAVILLAGGLASLYTGSFAFGGWGIFLFVSDSLVGIRAFPHPARPIRQLTPNRILLLIITIYYTAQFALVSWAL